MRFGLWDVLLALNLESAACLSTAGKIRKIAFVGPKTTQHGSVNFGLFLVCVGRTLCRLKVGTLQVYEICSRRFGYYSSQSHRIHMAGRE